jgi:transposase
VVGRKNWLFSGTPAGASASAAIYSLIETAKANGLEPYRYLRYLFERVPHATMAEDYRSLLPQPLTAADRSQLVPGATGG